MLYRLTLEVSLCYPSKELHSTFLCGGPFTVKYCVIMNRTSSLYYIQSITDHGRYSQLGRTWGSREAKSKNNDKRASTFDGSRILAVGSGTDICWAIDVKVFSSLRLITTHRSRTVYHRESEYSACLEGTGTCVSKTQKSNFIKFYCQVAKLCFCYHKRVEVLSIHIYKAVMKKSENCHLLLLHPLLF